MGLMRESVLESSWTMPVTVTATPEAMLLDNHEWDWGVSCSWHDDDQVDVEETLGRSQVGHRRWIAGSMQCWSGGELVREEVAVGRSSVTGIHCPHGGSPFADDSDTDSVNSHEGNCLRHITSLNAPFVDEED